MLKIVAENLNKYCGIDIITEIKRSIKGVGIGMWI